MRIVFMGTPEFAVPCLKNLIDAGHGSDHSGYVGYYTFKVQNIMGGLCNEGSRY